MLGGLSAAARWLGGKEADLLIVGHSLGGAMATLLLADLLLHPDAVPFPVRSTTAWHFGTPMVGDEEFRCDWRRMRLRATCCLDCRRSIYRTLA